jgi:2-isopropylmalate synthase
MPMFDARKYRVFSAPRMTDRAWPSRTVDHPPVWCSVDLRDGNQALVEPMGWQRKLRFFETLVAVGLKEIEVGFPAASQTDFDFVRMLIDERRIPDDVTIQVLTQARESLIGRTLESLRGARRAIVHVYNSTNPAQRKIVFGMSKEQVRDLAVQGTRTVKRFAAAMSETEIVLEYSPESFSATELDFAVEVVDAVTEAWDPSPRHKMIVNLPATVESAMPNVYADQVEWMSRHVARRDSIILSVHTHNDRGCAVAAAELAMLAGAERVEGTLFGNGERTGNADLVTLAMNLYTQGVAPGLDFSDIPALVEVYEHCNQMPVPARHPYAGALVFTAFSGSHQDAIAKGLAARAGDSSSPWEVPYLPIDPADVGRAYEPLIRINSQSGKSGIRFVLEQRFGYRLPKDLAIELGRLIQKETDATGKELVPEEILGIFERAYLGVAGRFGLVDYDVHHVAADRCRLKATVTDNDRAVEIVGEGTGAIDAFTSALAAHAHMPLVVADYAEHALSRGADAEAVAYVSAESNGQRTFGVGRDRDIVTASLHAIVRAANAHVHAQHRVGGVSMMGSRRPVTP